MSRSYGHGGGKVGMSRYVFYSFHYQNDIFRVNTVRNRWVTYGNQTVSGVIDRAEFEKIKRQGDTAIKRWIDEQMTGSSVTVVLIGSETLQRPYVQYEIINSIREDMGLIGVYINNITSVDGTTSSPCNRHTRVGAYGDGTPIYFDEIADGIYDYRRDDGYQRLGDWVEYAARKHGR